MRWSRILFVSLLALLAVREDARAFVGLDYLEVGDELPAGSLDGDKLRLAASPDGKHLYATGHFANTLLLFSIHPYSGKLTLEETYTGASSSSPFYGASDVLVAAGGSRVIVAQRGSGGVAVFARDADDGTLALVDQQRNGIAGVTGLSLPERIALDPAGRHLYALTTDSVVVFSVEADGTLEFVEDETAGFVDPFFDDVLPTLAVSPDGKHVYASSPDDGHLIVYSRNATSGALALVETENAGGTLAPSAVAVAPDGKHVYVATNPDCDHSGIAIFGRDAATGQLAHASTMIVEFHCLPTPRIAFRDGELCFSRIGENVAPTSNVYCYDRDAETGLLTRVGFGSGSLGSGFSEGISDFVFSGPYEYGVEPVSYTGPPSLSVKAYPAILPLETQQDGFDGVSALDGAAASVVSPDGRHVYVVSRFDGAVQIFERDGATGALEAAGEVRQGAGGVTSLSTPTDLAISPDGKHLYVTASTSDALTVFSRNATSGALTLVEFESDGQNGVTLFQAPSGVAVSPDGRFVLATSAAEDAVLSFARDAATGALTFADDFTGFLDQASDVDVSPDAAHVYVTAEGDGTLTGLTLGDDGSLSFFERLNDAGATDGLAGARDLVVSRDGRNIYVAGLADPRVAVFARDAANGFFTFVEALDALPGGVSSGLGGGDGVAISPDGAFVFAGDVHSNTQDVLRLMIYRRDPATGRLYEAGFDQGNTDAITVSPDGRNVYVAAFPSDRLAVFAPEPSTTSAWIAAIAAVTSIGRRSRRIR